MIAYVACAAALVVALPSLRRRRWGRAVRVASALLLLGGTLTVLSTTLRGSTTPTGRVNLVPGASIRELFGEDYRNAAENVLGNVLLFLPLGFLATIVTGRRIIQVTIGAAAFSTCIELAQLALGNRWVDIDDVLLNTGGALVGALVGAGAHRLTAALHGSRRDTGSAEAVPPRTP